MRLWDLEIELIPLGWERAYREALISCPNGENIAMDDDTTSLKLSGAFFHPVGYREKIINMFNQEKQRAKAIVEARGITEQSINDLFRIDVTLFSLLSSWLFPEDSMDGSSFDPGSVENDAHDIQFYFEGETGCPYLEDYLDFKLIRFQ